MHAAVCLALPFHSRPLDRRRPPTMPSCVYGLTLALVAICVARWRALASSAPLHTQSERSLEPLGFTWRVAPASQPWYGSHRCPTRLVPAPVAANRGRAHTHGSVVRRMCVIACHLRLWHACGAILHHIAALRFWGRGGGGGVGATKSSRLPSKRVVQTNRDPIKSVAWPLPQ